MLETMKKQLSIVLIFLVLAAILEACKSPATLSRSDQRVLNTLLEQSEIFNTGFTGFVLYDPAGDEFLINYRGDKYFSPASNTKILTLHASLEVLGDSIPLFAYTDIGDSLFIHPTGGPAFNSPFLDFDSSVIQLLANFPKEKVVVLCSAAMKSGRFGPGWAWDGFPFNYQAERSAFSLYGNRVKFTFLPGDTTPLIEPKYFEHTTEAVNTPSEAEGLVMASREERENKFFYQTDGLNKDTIVRYVPFIPDDSITVALFYEATGKDLLVVEGCKMNNHHTKYLYHSNSDSLYRRFMQASDNYLAEQLLLSISHLLFDTLDTYKTINYIKDSLIVLLPHPINWWDGSGLSRYNLITPESIAMVLKKLFEQSDFDRVLSFFPAGGESGTIRNWYAGQDGPFIFAKTGTLRNHHALSGYIMGKSGQWFIFSFMHNNFPGSSLPHRAEMERFFLILREKL